jgi:hypothetical protein
LLVNTAQNVLDNNLDAVVPYSPLADAFLQTLKIEYQQANGTLVLPGTSGQPAGPQQLFYANAEQKNMPSLNQGLADVAITGLIVRTPINPPKVGETVASNRDRLTGLALDAQGRYEVQVSLDGRNYSPKFHACATTACSQSGANLDLNDPGTQAYVKALDAQVFKDIGTGATAASLITPVGIPGATLTVLGLLASGGQVVTSEKPTETTFDEFMKTASEKGGTKFFEEVLGHTPGAAARASALINLSGGWDAFVERVKIDLLGVKSDESKK